MSCVHPWPAYLPDGLEHTADSLGLAIVVSTRRAESHGGDDMSRGFFEKVTAHQVYAVPAEHGEVDPAKPWMIVQMPSACHRSYATTTRRSDGWFTTYLCSQATEQIDTRIWSEAIEFRQDGDDPDGLLPDGFFGEMIEHYQPFPVEVLYSAEHLICGTISE